jgi:BCCT family betaine/carnitine transporter
MKQIASGIPMPANFNIEVFGLKVHRIIFPLSILAVLALVLGALLDPPAAAAGLESIKLAMLKHLDWLIMIGGNAMVLFCAVLAVSPYGKIRLGGKTAQPEFSTLSWFSMMFAAGMGVGLLYWGVAEPVAHYTAWFKTPFNVPGRTPEAAHAAMGATIFHWGFHPWAIYLTTAIVVGYFSYNKGLPFSLSSGLQPLLGKAHKGAIGHAVDIFTVVLTVFGLATSIGLGAMQATAGITHVLGLPNAFAYQMLFIAVVTVLAAVSLWRGLDSGVKLLSNLNMLLALVLFAIVVAGVGVMAFSSGVLDTTVDFGKYFLPLSNWINRPDQDWYHGWTVFYWAWWCTWGPLVGVFVARVSKGRTLRQMVGVVLLAPTVVAILWFTAFGGGAIANVMSGTGALASGTMNVDMAIFHFLETLPLFKATSLLVVVLLVNFMVTSVNSGALVVDSLAAGGDTDTPAAQRVIWLLMIAFVTVILFVIGDDTALKAIQAGSVAMGVPYIALMLLLIAGFVKSIAGEPR